MIRVKNDEIIAVCKLWIFEFVTVGFSQFVIVGYKRPFKGKGTSPLP